MKIYATLLILLVALTPLGARAQTTHTVTQSGLGFSPANLTIEVGDTVRWVWTSLAHTVTSGTGASDPNVGVLFDAPLNSFSPQFQFTFNQAGTVPYFCRPHELGGMTGTIVVEEVSTPAPASARPRLLVHGVEPNPFNPRTSVRFTLAEPEAVTITVHDVRGQLVRELVAGEAMEAGDREVLWDGASDDGSGVASGVYFFLVRTATAEQVARGVLVR
jgi:plastocyanin